EKRALPQIRLAIGGVCHSSVIEKSACSVKRQVCPHNDAPRNWLGGEHLGMTNRRVQVECYAGRRADDRPSKVILNGREHLVARLLSEGIEEAAATRKRVRRFKVLTDCGLELELLRHDGAWFLASKLRG